MSSNVTIGNLTALSTVSDTTVFASDDSGLTRKVSALVLKNYMSSLTSLIATGSVTAAGGVSANSIQAGSIGNVGAILVGTISSLTTFQPNIRSVGILSNLTVASNAAIGSNLSIGGNLVVSGAINNTVIGNTAPSQGIFTTVSAGTIGNTGAILTGTLSTPAQTNITALGTLGSLAVSGQSTLGNIVISNGVFWNNGAPYSTGSGSAIFSSVASSIIPSANLAYNIGSTTAWWNNIYGTAIHAQYADLAENYLADYDYPAGTVVVFGGEQEITVSDTSHTPSVAGIISSKPAYLMNSSCPGLPVALKGRVPCKVRGPVRKGDRLVNAGSGIAMKLDPALYQPGCVIGHALADIYSSAVETIEVVVMKF
jgi:hypothetical protein